MDDQDRHLFLAESGPVRDGLVRFWADRSAALKKRAKLLKQLGSTGDVLPSSPFACHTVNGGGGPSLLGRRKPSRTGKPAGGGRPSRQLFWRRGLTIACVAASVASVAAGTWSYWATFHTDDNAFLGWLGMALGFGSLAIHFSDERGVA